MSYRIENYSEKAIAVFGDTTSIKETLLELGGKFNTNLRGQAGWIFPKSKESNLKSALSCPQTSEKIYQQTPEKRVYDEEVEEEVVVKPKRLLKPTKSVEDKPSIESLLLNIIERLERIEAKVSLH